KREKFTAHRNPPRSSAFCKGSGMLSKRHFGVRVTPSDASVLVLPTTTMRGAVADNDPADLLMPPSPSQVGRGSSKNPLRHNSFRSRLGQFHAHAANTMAKSTKTAGTPHA